jgi:hypothetical protein
MKFLETTKDGGPLSTVWAHWLIELKGLFSIALLRFENGSRDAYHSRAFNCVSWVLSGALIELAREPDGEGWAQVHLPSWRPVITRRERMHKVLSNGRTWVLTFRGPWAQTWQEQTPEGEKTLRSGRVEVRP